MMTGTSRDLLVVSKEEKKHHAMRQDGKGLVELASDDVLACLLPRRRSLACSGSRAAADLTGISLV